MSVCANAGYIIGPTLAGELIDVGGVWLAFTAQSVLFAAGLLCVWRINPPPLPRRTEPSSIAADVRTGLAAVWEHPILRPLISLMAVGGLCMMGPAFLLLPRIVRDEFGRSADDAGMLFTAMGIGLVTTALMLMRIRVRRRGRTFLFGMGAGTTLSFFQGFVSNFGLLLAVMVCWGFTGGFYSNLSQTMVQASSPTHQMGRVMALVMLVGAGIAPLGALAAGTLAQSIGSGPALSVFGIAAFAAVAITFVRSPALRNLT